MQLKLTQWSENYFSHKTESTVQNPMYFILFSKKIWSGYTFTFPSTGQSVPAAFLGWLVAAL